MGNRRGSILVHVLITAVIVSVIASGLAQMMLSRYTVTIRAAQSATKRKEDDATLNRVITAWVNNGQSCSSAGLTPAYTVTGTAGTCNCTVTPNPDCCGSTFCPGSVVVTPGPTSCVLTINSCP